MKMSFQNSTIIVKNTGIAGETGRRRTDVNADALVCAAAKPYSIVSLVFIFFSVSFVGWLWEVVFHFMTSGNIVNRGTLHGPWLPIYGAASVFLILFLRKQAGRPGLLLAETIIACGFIEYITSVVLEIIFKTRWWDYSDMMLNINGRICAGGLALFGIGGLAVIYIAGPLLRKKTEQFDKKTALILCIAAIIIFAADVVISFTNIRTGAGITAIGY